MAKPSLSRIEGLASGKRKIAFFSDFRKVSLEDQILNYLVTTTLERENESPELSKRRREIASYLKVWADSQETGFPIVVPAYIYQALEKVARE